MEIRKFTEILRRGTGRIISRASPPAGRHLKDHYQRSSHPHREFLFVVSGTSRYLCNDSVYPCSPGTLFLFDSGIPHGHKYTREDNHLLHMWGYFNSAGLHVSCVNVMENGQYHLIPELSFIFLPEELLQFVETRWNLLARLENPTEEVVERYMKGPMDAVLDEVAFLITEHDAGGRKPTEMEKIERYIDSRNGNGCSLEHLASLLGCTRCHFAHKFHEKTGITVGKYIDQVRIKYVLWARKRGISQKEIAYELGFSSPSSFWNWLQKHRNELPHEDKAKSKK